MMTSFAWVFPGQGAQYPGMGKELYERSPEARALFERGRAALSMDLAGLCFDASAEELTRTSNAQPALLAVGYVQASIYGSQYELSPVLAAGHSLGEFTALAWSGALTFEDALRLVRLRGELMEAADPDRRGTMAAVRGLARDQVARACDDASTRGMVVIANENAPDEWVISGERSAVDAASQALEALGARVVPLHVSAAFHSPMMEPCMVPLGDALRTVPWSAPRVPVIANVDAVPYASADGWVDRLTRQLVVPVRWMDTVKTMERTRVDVVVESGPRAVLTGLVRGQSPLMAAFSVDDREGRRDLERHCFAPHFAYLKRALGVAVSTRNRNLDEDAYQHGVVEPVREVRALYRRLVEEDAPMIPAHARQARDMLEQVMATKQVSHAEAQARLKALVRETALEEFFAVREEEPGGERETRESLEEGGEQR